MKNITKIGIIGLGYVGLPLALSLAMKYDVTAYDKNRKRILDLKKGKDSNSEFSKKDINSVKRIKFSSDKVWLQDCNFFIITVPTPINKNKVPNLKFLKSASNLVGSLMKRNSIIVYESTVYPGMTEEVCVPLLEKSSGLKANREFFYGYSPERINPGDKYYKIKNIIKVISGSDKSTTKKINKVYSSIIDKTYIAENIMTAEAAKIIENTQRDLNIALINELSTFFYKLGIDTNQVINAAASKWNFMDFRPGLVGGHCIGVDPFYLTYKMKKMKILPKVILSGREINDSMGKTVAKRVLNLMNKKNISKINSKILILGFAFKENCTDYRNTKVVDIVNYLESKKCSVDICDYLIDLKAVRKSFKLSFFSEVPKKKKYDALIIAVGHDKYKKLNKNFILKYLKKKYVIFDVKSALPIKFSNDRL